MVIPQSYHGSRQARFEVVKHLVTSGSSLLRGYLRFHHEVVVLLWDWGVSTTDPSVLELNGLVFSATPFEILIGCDRVM